MNFFFFKLKFSTDLFLKKKERYKIVVAEKQPVYSTAPADWVIQNGV